MPSDLSPVEKEEREVSRLIDRNPAPSRKHGPKRGPKHDNRRRRMKVPDSDISGSDPDLSLNRKTQGSCILIAARMIISRYDISDLESAVSNFRSDLNELSPDLARSFNEYVKSHNVESASEGLANNDDIKKEIKYVNGLQQQLSNDKGDIVNKLKRADLDTIVNIIVNAWPSGVNKSWVERATVLSDIMTSIDSIKIPISYKIPFLRGDIKDVLQDKELLRNLIKSSGSISDVSEDGLMRFSQLASVYRILRNNPESVSDSFLRSSIEKISAKLDDQSRELFNLGEILDTWTSMLKNPKSSNSKKFTIDNARDYGQVLKDLDHFFNKSDIIDPTFLMEELEAYTKKRFRNIPPELEGMFDGFRSGETSNENVSDEVMPKRVATYHGVIDTRGNPIKTTDDGYQSFHSRNFTEDNYKAILAYAKALLLEPWLKYGWDGGKKDAQLRAALDLSINLADNNLYQSKIDVETYNILYSRLADTGQDTFSETMIPVQEKVKKKKRSAAMKRKEYNTIVRIASDLRKRNPAAAFTILKNLRELISTTASNPDTTVSETVMNNTNATRSKNIQSMVGLRRTSQDKDIEFKSLSDSDFRNLKDDVKSKIEHLFGEKDVAKFLKGFEDIVSDVEHKTASSLSGVPLNVLIKLASSSEGAKKLLGPVIIAAKKRTLRPVPLRLKRSSTKNENRKSTLTVTDLDW